MRAWEYGSREVAAECERDAREFEEANTTTEDEEMNATTRQIDDRVTCERCRQRLIVCPTNEHGFPLAGELYEVGNPAGVDMGHQHYHTKTGRTALCVARKTNAE